MNQFKLAVIQDKGHANPKEGLSAYITGIKEAATLGAEMVLLPELHNTLYFCQVESMDCFSLAETIPGPTTEALSALARELNVVIVASVFEKRAPGLYHNTAVVLDRNGEMAGTYRKMHIPDDPGFYEKYYFSPGDLGFNPIETAVGKIGVLVCWDQWFPEAARLQALAGAEILVYPTAIGWITEEHDQTIRQRQQSAWVTIQRAHAIANGIPVAVCNRYGFEPSYAENAPKGKGIDFWGTSFVCGPQGEMLAEAPESERRILLATLDKQQTELVRHGWPYLRDRRIDAYEALLLRYRDRG
ncbi:MAG: acyltransferase [Gammaproteobacteria bacterium RIFCSPHIGHO2_12_FULL_45_9]|nr:MAG: acyltransferase [Gammaproteobacteria bacterium RIFCSPHIGHO2_12_FULL_45_9]